MKIRNVYIGFVINKNDLSNKSVSASNSKTLAGELMEKWLKENDPNNFDYVIGGVENISGVDYIKF